ncbi:MAG: hypothetical protein ACFB2X_12995 [Rivularia sp. (in: cyanobacteria)]
MSSVKPRKDTNDEYSTTNCSYDLQIEPIKPDSTALSFILEMLDSWK